MLKDMICEAKNIVFFGGAGVSTESGIPDFRSAHGIFKQTELSCEEILSGRFFRQYPKQFYSFYKKNMVFPNANPNEAHKALAMLEKIGKLRAVITQNIDGLHQMAGSHNVIELHGSVHHNTCMSCGAKYDLKAIIEAKNVPQCTCGGIIRPDVVLYGELLKEDNIASAIAHIEQCDLLIVGGTSLVVYPAAGFVSYAKGKIVIINRNETPFDSHADLTIHDSIGHALGSAIKEIEMENWI